MKIITFNCREEDWDGVSITVEDPEAGTTTVWEENTFGSLDQWLLYAPLDEPVLLRVVKHEDG